VTDFRASLVEQARKLVAASEHCSTEEGAKFSLIAPFLEFLGYDVRDPAEVRPEHHADFSDKYKNRVDFAILREGIPVIAIECKGHGATRTDDRGQLKSYFNAAKTVKLGVLTDGIVWEFFADSDEPNLMDDTPFLSVNLKPVAEGKVSAQALEGLQQVSKQSFDPENVGAEARRKFVFQSFVDQVRALVEAPSESFCRTLLDGAGVKRVRSANMGAYQDLAKQAIQAVIDARILSRLDLPSAAAAGKATEPVGPSNPPPFAEEKSKIVTTEDELRVFEWAKQRLAFLVDSEALFASVDKLAYHDYQNKFVVHLGGERKGRVFDLVERDGAFLFTFAHGGPEIETVDFSGIDDALLASFKAVAEA
jgi:hypothetical protein